ncbi:class I SAM-dependent methyltransferase [Methylomonas rapida]|uniref:Class I SAM-dependent methyltransferase n=1 Tax=Methylomonas rapida TaxID=2963939 RepID=A0ABY7GFT2_9GAMM|nr:class I SAM-dependent methyltransferase [Methylomonas rapida]WAR43847.1 class I SAM-dependent methyltransferase [Methylomonas rapida]
MPNPVCPLCLDAAPVAFYQDKNRDYYRCRRCHLVFVPPAQHLSPDAEKAIYDFHQNQLDDPGYRQFLSRLATPLQEKLSPASSGLDYGCGPGPLLAQMLKRFGHDVEVYDPFYANRPQHLQRRYDFVTCTEVVEHFRQPAQEFERLFGLLQPDGLLGLMTKLVIDAEAFSRWHYKNDLTHVSFFSKTTMQWLAETYHCELEFVGKDVMIFRDQRKGG